MDGTYTKCGSSKAAGPWDLARCLAASLYSFDCTNDLQKISVFALLYLWYLVSYSILALDPNLLHFVPASKAAKSVRRTAATNSGNWIFFWMSAFANHKRYAGQCHRTWAAWSDVCLLEWMYLEYPQRYPKASTDLQVLFGLVFGFLRSLGEGCCFIVCVCATVLRH